MIGNFGDDPIDQYKVRVIDKATNYFYFDSGIIKINSTTNKYKYNLGDLSVYGDDLWIAIEAKEAIGTVQLANRSGIMLHQSRSPVQYGFLAPA